MNAAAIGTALSSTSQAAPVGEVTEELDETLFRVRYTRGYWSDRWFESDVRSFIAQTRRTLHSATSSPIADVPFPPVKRPDAQIVASTFPEAVKVATA